MTNNEEVNGWISVEDRLPKENTEVIGVDRSGVFWIAEQDDGFWNNDTKSHWIINITHWQPLPSPPEAKEQEDE